LVFVGGVRWWLACMCFPVFCRAGLGCANWLVFRARGSKTSMLLGWALKEIVKSLYHWFVVLDLGGNVLWVLFLVLLVLGG
jgi:hypothetical protein